MSLKRHNFSAVELLVVIGVAAVLMGLALPGFNHMINGDKVTAAARQLSSAIAHARSEAILSGRNVALLLPMFTNWNATDNKIKESYQNRSYAVVRLARDSEGVNSTTDIDLNSLSEVRWSLFPKGALLLDVTGNGNSTFNASSQFNSHKTLLKSVSVADDVPPLNQSGGTSYYALIFKPDGTLYGTTSTLYLYIAEGIAEQGTNSSKIVPTNKDSSGGVQNILTLSLNPYTGRCRFED